MPEAQTIAHTTAPAERPIDRCLQAWMPSADILACLPATQAYLTRTRPDIVDDNVVESGSQHMPGSIRTINTLAAIGAKPHVDDAFPPWSILWILAHGRNHQVGISDQFQKDTRQPSGIDHSADQITVTLAVGQVLILHTHRLHWLKASSDQVPFWTIGVDLEDEPTRIEAEEVLRTLLRAHGLRPRTD